MTEPAEPDHAGLPERFAAIFGRMPTTRGAAPGRVNLIGEHVDYQDGWVLPMALERSLRVLMAPSSAPSGTSRVHSTLTGETVDFSVDAARPIQSDGSAPSRIAAIALALREAARLHVPDLDILIDSDLPAGGGLSSSAALSVATARAMLADSERRLETLAIVECCRRAERLAAGVACGLMDPLVILEGRAEGEGEDHARCALLIDCGQKCWERIALPSTLGLVLVDTGVRHDLATAPYAQRQHECAEAAARLSVATLRDAFDRGIDATSLPTTLPPPLDARARHVLSELRRVRSAVDSLRSNDLRRFGLQLRLSHASLRDDFEVSCPELDEVVDTAHRVGAAVHGARMTGAGFGGCVLVACDAEWADEVAEVLRDVLPPQCTVHGMGRGGG